MTQEPKKSHDLPKRSELDTTYTWDLTKIFASDEQWEQAFQDVQQLLPSIADFQGKLAESAEILFQGLQAKDHLSEKLSKVYVYAHLKKDQDTTNSTYVSMEAKASSLIVEASSALSYFDPEILSADETVIIQYLAEHEKLKVYGHVLHEMLRQKEHVLSAQEEAIIAQAGELANAPEDIFSMINNADMTFPKVKDETGEERELTHGRFIQFMENKDRRVRQDAFKTMYGAYDKQKNTIATTLNANIKKDLFYSRVRKYPSNLEAALDKDHIPTDVYDNLISTIHDHLPLFQRYMRLRKKVLDVDDLHMYDLYVPLVKEAEMTYSYEQAQDVIKEAFHPLGQDYIKQVEAGLSEGWIDVYENVGKRSGAYSSGTFGTPPYILLNYQESLDNVFTLAHEMGHSMHSHYANQEQPYVYANYTIFVAEVASTLNEALLTHHLLNITDDPKQKMTILNHYLEGFRGTVFRQTMFAEFEKKIHELVAQGQALTPDVLYDLYYELNVTYYGQELEVDEEIGLEWARIPHFYMSFYVYKYATGFAAATALSKKILEEGPSAVERYLSFLKSGGSDYPIELLKKAGVDMTSPEPIKQALQVFESTLEELERLFEQQL